MTSRKLNMFTEEDRMSTTQEAYKKGYIDSALQALIDKPAHPLGHEPLHPLTATLAFIKWHDRYVGYYDHTTTMAFVKILSEERTNQ